MIAGAVAAGVLYPQHGYISLSSLAAIPVGIVLIILGARKMRVESAANVQPQKTNERFADLKKLDWQTLAQSEENINSIFPMDTFAIRAATREKLQALTEELAFVGLALDVPRLRLLNNNQLKYLPWAEIAKDAAKIESLFPIGTYRERGETAEKLRALDAASIKILTPVLSVEHLSMLCKS